MEIWMTELGKFLVTEGGDTIILIPEEGVEPTSAWTADTTLSYDTAWDLEE
jgi:hypothetical protein